jgi:hypothetical protein
MEDIINLLTDAENQPHQFIGSPDELRAAIAQAQAIDRRAKYDQAEEYEDEDEDEVAPDAPRCACTMCFCINDTDIEGSTCGDCAAGAHQG